MHFSGFRNQREMISHENALLTRMAQRFTADFIIQHWLSGIDHTLKHWDDLISEMRDHLMDRSTYVFFHGLAIDIAQSLVYAHLAVILVRNTQRNWCSFVQMRQL